MSLLPEDLNPNYYLPHSTGTYTCEVTIVLRVCGDEVIVIIILSIVQKKKKKKPLSTQAKPQEKETTYKHKQQRNYIDSKNKEAKGRKPISFQF